MALTLGDLVVYLRGDDKHISKTIDNVQAKVNRFGSGIADSLKQSFSFAVGGVIERGLTSIAAGIQNAASSAFDAVKDHELLSMSLESLIARQFKAADSSIAMSDALAVAGPMAEQLLDWVQKLGITSPFDDKDIQTALQMAAAYKFSIPQAKELTQALVDNAAAGGKSAESINRAMLALGQINLEGRVTKENLNQLTDAGVDYVSALDRMGKSLDDVTSGAVSADEFIRALTETINSDAGGAAARATNTWSGLVSSLESMTRTGAIEFFGALLEPLRPLVTALADAAAAQGLRESLRELGEMAADFVAPAIEWLTSKVEALPQFFDRAAGFIRQFRDEMSGITAGDIMAGLPGQLEGLQQNFDKTMAVMAQAHAGTVAKIQEQIAQAGTALGTKLGEINEKYADKIEDLNERIAETAASFAERINDEAEQHAKKRAAIEERIAKSLADREEKLTDLKRDHARRRRELTTDLLTAETEEQYLQIKSQIQAEDEKYREQVNKTKTAGDEQVSELREQLKEEDSEYAKQAARLQRQRDKALADLNEQLSEVQAAKAEEVAEVQAAYDQEVAALQDKLARENQLYADSVAEQKALFEQQKADAVALANARAEALGSGPAHDLAEQVKAGIAVWDEFKKTVSDFITNYATPLKGALIGIGAVILGGGILAGLSALAGLLSGISVPILAIVAGVATLYTAWTQNWGGIQEKTAAALAFLQPYWEQLKTVFGNFIDLLLPRLQEVWTTLTTQWNETVAPALDRLWASVQKLAEKLGISIDKSTAMEAILWLVKAALAAVLMAVDGLNPLIDGFSLALATALGIVDGFVKSLGTLKDAWGAIGGVVDGLITKFGEFGEAAKAAWDLIPPQWKPGSPTPFETGLRGIADALNKMPDLGQVFAPPEIQPGALAGAVSSPTIYLNQTNHLPTAPAGFDAGGLMNQIDQRTEQLILQMLYRFYEQK